MGDASEHPTHIGPYPVEGELGRGGMGVVYLGRDPRLNRQVAIKVLPAAFVSDPMRLQRFEREARTLAALNHRNIGMIFGLEDADGQRLLVLEFIPGHTLTEKLARPIPIDETVRLAAQIAEGLEVAHERDVVHRDLKPDNVRVTPEGMVKLLDFGLATQQGTNHEGSTAAGSQLTHAGMVMGTPGYMSPEQARGLPIDKRTDIWAFGCVLFEMLSGYKAFGGETVSDCIAAILDREPDYSLIPARTPNRLRELVVRCLVKDARRRLRDIGDARIEL
ncbi:MAG TPA: serine/threonine-protein kinase, partial [Phycisphaerales bacterium]|nr:serine/threonine-protein kinase [Phycisphaerales bacterium]